MGDDWVVLVVHTFLEPHKVAFVKSVATVAEESKPCITRHNRHAAPNRELAHGFPTKQCALKFTVVSYVLELKH